MKFKEKYPDMKPIHDQRGSIIRSNGDARTCHQCKEETEYVEINYEAAFCSEECIANFENGIDWSECPDCEPENSYECGPCYQLRTGGGT